jgi:hypothetical protein
MKKIYYFLAFVFAAVTITACNPLDKSYKQLGDLPTPTAPATSGTLTLAAADYGLLPSSYPAQKKLYFKTLDSAKMGIPFILASKYPAYGEKSNINVTFATAPVTLKAVDSVFANIAYTLLPADYTLNGGTTTFTNFSASQIITWLGIKYPGAAENKLAVITFNFFDQGATTTGVQQSFLFTGGVWTKLYHITPVQYNSIGKGGNNNDFVTADASLIPSYLNAFLKVDPSVSVTAKVGDIKYVSFKYFQASTGSGATLVPAVTSQRVTVLTFDGTNWTTTSTPVSLIFAKTNGVWVADNTVNYTLTPADHVTIAGLTFGSAAARANLLSFKSVDLRSTSATKWLPEEIANAVAAFAKIKYGTGEQNQIFNLSYYGYTGTYAYVVVKLKYIGTDFVIQP